MKSLQWGQEHPASRDPKASHQCSGENAKKGGQRPSALWLASHPWYSHVQGSDVGVLPSRLINTHYSAHNTHTHLNIQAHNHITHMHTYTGTHAHKHTHKHAGICRHMHITHIYTFRSDQISQISRLVLSDSLQPHEPQHARPPCPSPTPGDHPDSHPSSQ